MFDDDKPRLSNACSIDLKQFQAQETDGLFVETEEMLLEMQHKLEDFIHGKQSSAIPSFVNMLEQTLHPASHYGRKNDIMQAMMPFVDMLQATAVEQDFKPDHFAIPPSFLDILNEAITNSKRLRKQTDTVIRPFVDILRTISTNSNFHHEGIQHEVPSFVGMLEQVVWVGTE